MAEPARPRPNGALPITRAHLFAMAALALTMSVLSFFIGLQLGKGTTPAVIAPGVRPLLDEEARSGNLEALLLRVEQAQGQERLVFPEELARSKPPLPPLPDPAAVVDPAAPPVEVVEPPPAIALEVEPREGGASLPGAGAGSSVGGEVPTRGWALDVGTRADAAEADQLVASLVSSGLAAYRVEARVDGRSVHHVRVGGYTSKDAAVSAAAEVKARAGASEATPVEAP